MEPVHRARRIRFRLRLFPCRRQERSGGAVPSLANNTPIPSRGSHIANYISIRVQLNGNCHQVESVGFPSAGRRLRKCHFVGDSNYSSYYHCYCLHLGTITAVIPLWHRTLTLLTQTHPEGGWCNQVWTNGILFYDL